MNDAYDDASTLLDDNVPLSEFLDEQLARARVLKLVKLLKLMKSLELKTMEHRPGSPRFELPKIPEGYVMDGEVSRDFLACKDRDDLKKLLCKFKVKSLNARMK